ncbi:serine/threonine-protein phosphatase 6 regulatory subunit 3-like isoform X2 [Xenia sp. Carnegie-2017]|uniref:serine/threonine-protein phosphatase 6 regulatory subunit 3-like isoform X2 n=1 Tax=Xenia sp. Carnegie-2017 TaxID=2897299 RepID=UPI001F0446ED|nr:serine/threonine-protein phosphatase 6 regulatory subunit 3-like isoform X2 [Xenia sp. Carnegie-2017]
MFWKFDLHSNSSLDTVLSKDDCTLSEVLDEDDVLQECKSQNRKLLDFLTRKEILEEMVDLIVMEPDEEVEDKLRYKYPNVACEILTSDVQIIVEKLAENEVLLDKLWQFLDTEKTLNPLLASFFSKVFSLVAGRKTNAALQFLKSKKNPIDSILRHIDTSAIMDLVLKFCHNIDMIESRSDVLQWLNNERLIQKLVEIINPRNSPDKIYNSSQCICELIKSSREQMSQLQECALPDPILSTIEDNETLSVLLDRMLHEVHLSSSHDSIVGGINILLTLLEINKANSESPFSNVELGEPLTPLDAERLNHGVSVTLSAILPKLNDFHHLLTNPPPMVAISTTAGTLEPPFGKTRLQIMKLFAVVLQAKRNDVKEELAKLGTLNVMWELFFRYPWNNFLHAQVEHCINSILCNAPTDSSSEHDLLRTLMKDLNIVHEITKAFDLQENGNETIRHRHGYMGHLTKIANNLYKNINKGKNQERLTKLYDELKQEDKDKWEQFVSGKLAEINKKNNTDLAGRHPLQSSDDDDDDYRSSSYLHNGNTASYQQAFANYQLQQMAPEFLDSMGFDEDHFPESDDDMNAPYDRITNIDFTTSSQDNSASVMFEEACNERIRTYDDSDDEDVWSTKEITFSPNAELRGLPSEDSGSSDSDDEGGKLNETLDDDNHEKIKDFDDIRTSSPCSYKDNDYNMDIDNNDPWSANFDSDAVSMEVVQSANPSSVGWATPGKTGESEEGWAKFDDIDSIGGPSSSTPSRDESCNSPVAMDTEAVPSAGSVYIVNTDGFSDNFTKEDTPSDDVQEVAIEEKLDDTVTVSDDGPSMSHDTAKNDVALTNIHDDDEGDTSSCKESTVKSSLEDFVGEKDGIVKTENMAKQAVIADNINNDFVGQIPSMKEVKEEHEETNKDDDEVLIDNCGEVEKHDMSNESEGATSQEKIPVSACNGPMLS